ncbi:MAG: outer membrane lipoprotein-sorting protein [Deltaproteobacteria bacterium]|nr:outer membrane lipoprotein-sorting protein [Deltaproteobacteria bacterium]MBW1942870.1 outer membrane lipoprotein-sorting protein [Deltaproteobacteria bacterium]MBW2207245.1 outer membrane lipoprotein-sorting protein [Deltaproteobacteria bacterium]
MCKRKSLFLIIAAASLLLFTTPSHSFSMTGDEVAMAVEKARRGFKDSESKLVMTLINASGAKSLREMASKMLEKPEGSQTDGDMSIITFLSPADIKGTGLLTHEKLDREDDQWLYLPALRRVKRIASKNKSGSFMGSEFAYEDISSQSVEKYTYSKAAGEETVNGIPCYRYERYPKSKYSGYTKQIVWANKKNFTTIKTDYFDRKKELLKTAVFSDYKKIKGIWRVGKIYMKNLQNKKETILVWEADDIQGGLKKRDFKKRMLSRQ